VVVRRRHPADDPLLHAAVIAYASDLSLFDTILAPHAVRWDDPNFMVRASTLHVVPPAVPA